MLYGFFGAATVFFALAGIKALAMGLTILISRHTRQVLRDTGESALRFLWEGVRYAFQDRTILALLVVSSIPSLLIYPYVFVALPFFAFEVLDRGAQGFGWLQSGLGWGSIVGLMVLAFAGNFRRKGPVMIGTLLLYPLLVAAFAQSQVFLLSMGILMLAGLFHGPAMALANTLLLLKTRDDMTGRIMALKEMSNGLTPLGAVPLGMAIDLWGAPNAVTVFVLAAAVVIAITAIIAKSLRHS